MTQFVSDKGREAVKRLRMYFRNNPALVFQYGGNDKGFLQWVNDVLAVVHAEDMERVKQILEGGKA